MATYTVVSGDTLGAIAAQHATTIEALQAANAALITDVNVIQVGWELTIPGDDAAPAETESETETTAPATSEYTVQPGDTLGALAAAWGTTVAALQALNNLADPDRLAVGQVLLRPGTGGGASDGTAVHDVTAQTASGELQFTTLPLRMPPARINGGYLEDYGGYLHRGFDLGGVAIGTPIFAPAGGRATVHRPNDGTGFDSFGICVVLDHPGTPYWSIYAHMDGTDLETGAVVQAGDVIGRLGWTGKVVPPDPGGAHLHWQVSDSRWFPASVDSTRDPSSFLTGVTMPGQDDIPVGAGEILGLCLEDLAGPTPPAGEEDSAKPAG